MYIGEHKPLHRNPVRDTVERAALILERYPHLNRREAIIAFSGGKDSVALACVMRELGKDVYLRAVDMGYSPQWESRIKKIADHLRLPVNVLKVREMMSSNNADRRVRSDLVRRREFLEELEANPTANITPCTNCYNCKLIAMTRRQTDADELLFFGHHSDDMVSSFLKSCIMYQDRWEEGHVHFERENFINLTRRVTEDLKCAHSVLLDKFLRYVESGLAATEEPPYEEGSLHGAAYGIGRPLILVSEQALKAYSDALDIRLESSGCGHSLASSARTPRELIQYDLLPAVRSEPTGRKNLACIELAILEGFSPEGMLRFDARRTRADLLGGGYKNGDLQDKY